MPPARHDAAENEMASSSLLNIILIATVAGFILFRLYTVLGRRTGHERPPQDNYRLKPAEDAVGVQDNGKLAHAVPAERPSDPVASGLFDIGLADRNFDKDQFLKGARAAYEMILSAFAAGDRMTLKPMLNDEVFAAFDSVIRRREQAAQKASLTLVGFNDVKVIAAALKGNIAEITLAFGTRLISSTVNAEGVVVEGDAKSVREVTDVWTFTRDVRARDPNWALVATSSEPL
jgi:predicted lipid-binding transport protein (Tim44 family)